MMLTKVNSENWPRLRKKVFQFISKYKDSHITPETSASFRSLGRHDLEREGTLVLIATEQSKLLGVLACSDYGRGFSLAVVCRTERGRGVGKELLRKAIAELGEFHVVIASDNVPSLKVAFACGLTAYGVFVRDNGKIALRLKTPSYSTEI